MGADTPYGGNNFRNIWGASGEASRPRSAGSEATHAIDNGYTARFIGWTHTRSYATGLLQNSEANARQSTPYVYVSGLAAGTYAYKLFGYGASTNRVAIFSGTCSPSTWGSLAPPSTAVAMTELGVLAR